MAGIDGYSLDTLALHAGTPPDPATGARALPIHLTTSFVFRDADHAAFAAQVLRRAQHACAGAQSAEADAGHACAAIGRRGDAGGDQAECRCSGGTANTDRHDARIHCCFLRDGCVDMFFHFAQDICGNFFPVRKIESQVVRRNQRTSLRNMMPERIA